MTSTTEIQLANDINSLTADAIAKWSDNRRTEFVKTFKKRITSARYILDATAQYISQMARDKQFISEKHTKNIKFGHGVVSSLNYYSKEESPTDRSFQELDDIAEDKAKSILKELPPLHKAIEILDKSTSEKIVKRDDLVEKCRKLTDKFNTLSETIKMSEIDQNMTVGEFRKMVKDREKARSKLILEIDEFAKEAHELDKEINKALYSGIAGLSEAVVSAIQLHLDKCQALDQLGRRVEEQVMFGDSEAAMTILKKFEEDELAIPDQIKTEFKQALQALKVKPVKAVSGGKKK